MGTQKMGRFYIWFGSLIEIAEKIGSRAHILAPPPASVSILILCHCRKTGFHKNWSTMGKLYFIDVIKGRLYSSLIQQLACLSQITVGLHSIAQVTLNEVSIFSGNKKTPFRQKGLKISKSNCSFLLDLSSSLLLETGRVARNTSEKYELTAVGCCNSIQL